MFRPYQWRGLQPAGVGPSTHETPQAEARATSSSKLDMQAEGRSNQGAAVAVVAGVVDVLRVERREDSAPHVQRVVGFDNVLAPIVQFAVAEQEAEASEGQIFLMVARNSVGNERQARAVQLPFPLGSLRAGADLLGFVHFGVGVRFVLPFVPSPSREKSEPFRQR